LRICKHLKYSVLELIMKGVVFEKKKMRETFLQEILREVTDSGIRASLEAFLVSKGLVFDDGERERVIISQWVEVQFGSVT